MHVLKTNFNGNNNVGLYLFTTDEYCLVGHDVPEKLIKKIQQALSVKVHKIKIAGTSLLGVFLAGNSKCLLVPKIAFESEIKVLEKLKINYEIIDTELTALGNNVLCNNSGCLINPEFDDKIVHQIQKALDVPVKKSKIADIKTIGALAVHNKNGCLVHRDAEEFELDLIEDVLKVKVSIGTINFGSPYIKSGLAANSNGFIIGDISGGPEIQNVDISLGFI